MTTAEVGDLLIAVSGETARASWLSRAVSLICQSPQATLESVDVEALELQADAHAVAMQAHATLSLSDRHILHETALQAIEEYEFDPGWAARGCAWHSYALGRSDEAERLIRQAVAFAVAAGDNTRALTDYEIALHWAVDADQSLRWNVERASLATQLDTPPPWTAQAWSELLERARAMEDHETIARALLNLHWLLGNDEPTTLTEASQIADLAPAGWAWRARALELMYQGKYAEAAVAYRRAIQIGRARHDTTLEALSHEGLGFALYWQDEESLAIRHATTAAQLYRAAHDPQGDLVATTLCIEIQTALGQHREAFDACDALADRVRRLGGTRWLPEITAQRALVHLSAGEFREAAELASSLPLPEGVTPRNAVLVTAALDVAVTTADYMRATMLLDLLDQAVAADPALDLFDETTRWARFVVMAQSATPVDLRKHFAAATDDASPLLSARVSLWAARHAAANRDAHLARSIKAAVTSLGPQRSTFVTAAAAEITAHGEQDPARKRARLSAAARAWDELGRSMDAAEAQLGVATACIANKDNDGAQHRLHEVIARARAGGNDDLEHRARQLMLTIGSQAASVHVADHPFLKACDPRLAGRLEALGRVRTYQPSAMLMEINCPPQLALILRGSVRLHTPDAQRRIVDIRGPYELAGEAHLNSGTPTFDVEARDEVLAWVVPIDRLLAFAAAEPSLTVMLVQRTAEEQSLKALIAQRGATWPVQARLANVLVDLTERFGRDMLGKPGKVIQLGITTIELADLAATTRKSVSPLLGRLRDDGVVEHSRKRLIVHDVARLRSLIPDSGHRAA